MSETALTLIKSAYRSLGVIASGETPTADEVQDGLQALQFMLRSWSAQNLRLYYTKQESVAMTGAASYTIGSGGDINSVRPTSIRGAWTADNPVSLISEDRYRQVRMSTDTSGPCEYLWYSPEYPLGVLYPWPYGGATLYIDSLKPLTDPTVITDSIAFPPPYDEAIKYNLAVRLASESEREPSNVVATLASVSLRVIENMNFAEQVNPARLEIIKIAHARYNIDNG